MCIVVCRIDEMMWGRRGLNIIDCVHCSLSNRSIYFSVNQGPACELGINVFSVNQGPACELGINVF